MRNHVSIREVPADTELALHLLEEGKVEIHRLIKRAVERSHRRRGPAAARACASAEQNQFWWAVFSPGLLRKNLLPHVLGVAQDFACELSCLVCRLAAVLLWDLLHLRSMAAADHLGAADEDAWINAERPPGKGQNNDRPDAETTPT